MSKGKKLLQIIKKLIKFISYFILAILLIANLFIILSGRFYLYKGIANTYLKGRSGPSIYDKDVFFNNTIHGSKKPQSWIKSSKYNSKEIPSKYQKLFDQLDTKAFLVFKGDSIVFEKYLDEHKRETVSNSFSAAKTVVALLIGAAIDDGKIKSLDEKVGKYIPEFNTGGKEKITIRHLLMMSSGLDWQESGKNPLSENAESYYGNNLYGLVTRQHAIEKPGVRFEYQSGNSQLLGFIIEKATKKDLSSYCQAKIWDKIGAEKNAFWSLDKENGDEKSFCCMYASARDFGRLGKLILNKGKWGDQQVISEKYMTEMCSNPKMSTDEHVPNLRYGLHIWSFMGEKKPIWYCRGILGQYIITIPSEDLVIVRLGQKRSENISVPENKVSDQTYLKKNAPYIGHPKDLFDYVKLGRIVAK
jgi:CubicO group peptidase (beta-lactamase class C family)